MTNLIYDVNSLMSSFLWPDQDCAIFCESSDAFNARLEVCAMLSALREEEATRIQELENAREALLITSRILQERALKASELSQKITQAPASLKLEK
jgi:hypothetical protein